MLSSHWQVLYAEETFFLQPEGGALSVVLLGEIGTSVHISLAMLILQLKTCLIEGIRILICT